MNTETKHTPGPWIVRDETKIIGPTGNVIAECFGYSVKAEQPYYKAQGGREANAALIASAPDMAKEIAQLKADKRELVKGLCNISLQIHNQLTAHERTPFLTLAEKNARNLIAKHSNTVQ